MGPSDAKNIIILIVLLLLSAFFSSAETSLTTVSKLKMRALAEDKNKAAKRVLKLIEKPSKMLSTVLICNNIVNLSASSISTSYAFSVCTRLGLEDNMSLGAGIATGVLTLLILIFGEITPKNMATLKAEKMALSYSGVILFLTNLLTPIIFLLDRVTRFILFILRIDPDGKHHRLRRTNFVHLLMSATKKVFWKVWLRMILLKECWKNSMNVKERSFIFFILNSGDSRILQSTSVYRSKMFQI